MLSYYVGFCRFALSMCAFSGFLFYVFVLGVSISVTYSLSFLWIDVFKFLQILFLKSVWLNPFFIFIAFEDDNNKIIADSHHWWNCILKPHDSKCESIGYEEKGWVTKAAEVSDCRAMNCNIYSNGPKIVFASCIPSIECVCGGT